MKGDDWILPIIQKEKITVKFNASHCKHYQKLKYKFNKTTDVIKINYWELPRSSHVKVKCECDFCHKEFEYEYYKTFHTDKIACSTECRGKLYEYRCMKWFGVRNMAQIPFIQEKIKETNLKKWGAKNVFGSPAIQEKIRQTNIENYGVPYGTMAPEVQAKIAQTNMDNRGVPNVFMDEIIKEHIRQTNLEKCGVKNVTQCMDVRQKMVETYRKNGNTKASNEQIYYANLFNGELDYPLYGHLVDIAFPDKQIYIECDFGGHFAYSRIHQSDVNMIINDSKRDRKIMSHEGWKVIRYLTRTHPYLNDSDAITLNNNLMKILETTNIDRILVDLNFRIVRFEPGYLFKSIDLFL